MCVYIYDCIFVRIVCMLVCLCIYISEYIFESVFECVYIPIHGHVYEYENICAWNSVNECMYLCIFVSMHVCMCTCTCVPVNMHARILRLCFKVLSQDLSRKFPYGF